MLGKGGSSEPHCVFFLPIIYTHLIFSWYKNIFFVKNSFLTSQLIAGDEVTCIWYYLIAKLSRDNILPEIIIFLLLIILYYEWRQKTDVNEISDTNKWQVSDFETIYCIHHWAHVRCFFHSVQLLLSQALVTYLR